jgi:hypothetical protein
VAKSKYVHADADGGLVLRGPDGTEVRMVGVQRMHFYRLAGATPEDATDEQVERYFSLRAQEEQTGQRVTEVLRYESATNMVTRELGIINLPQVAASDPNAPAPPSQSTPSAFPPPTLTTPRQEPPAAQRRPTTPQPPPNAAQSASAPGLGQAPRYRPGEGLPPAPRYQPGTGGQPARAEPEQDQPRETPLGTRFLRREGPVLYIQAPDGAEQRVTQYMRVHFLRMLEKEIEQATDQDIEMWWKLQGSLDAGATLQEAQSQNLLTEALKAAGKLKRTELEVLHQAISAWLQARAD